MSPAPWQPSYEELAYPSLPLPQTQPDRMASTARLLGVSGLADPGAARVLELGCSDGGNLAWLAAYAPQSQFVGVDLSQSAIARGRAAAGDLPNLRLAVGDLADLDLGGFDYVIAHGVYSWLPDPDVLLAAIRRHLTSTGIAYISYNTKPGWYVRDLAGSVLRRVAGSAADPLAAVHAARDWLIGTGVETPHARMLRQTLELTRVKPDHVLAHDELSGPSHAPFFDEFVTNAASHGLSYLCESHPGDAELPGVTVPASWAGDEIARQQWLDYARNRSFRQTLLVPATAAVAGPIDPAQLSGLWAAAPAEQLADADAQGRVRLRLLGGVELTTDSDELVSDLLTLGLAWPGNVPARELRADPRALLTIYLGHGLELRTAPIAARMPGARPLVAPHVRRLAATGAVATARHELLTLEDDLTRAAVSLCDGEHERAAIAHTLSARAATTPGAAPPPNLRKALDDLLQGLGRAGLMLG